MHKRVVLCLALVIGTTASASFADTRSAGAVAWPVQVATVDFSKPGSAIEFARLVEEAHEKTLLYIDWTFRNVARSGLFESVSTNEDSPATDETICGHVERRAALSGGLTIRGKPDHANNHLLLEMTLDVARGAPFARARCEYVSDTYALRLRGFFYVTNIGTPTAKNLEFAPVSMPAHHVPRIFLKYLQ